MKQNESFIIYYREGWAWLTVFPSTPGGKPVYPEDVQGKCKLLGIPSVRKQQLYRIIETASGIPEKLSPWPEGKTLGPNILIKVSEDGMSVVITISEEKPGGEPLSLDLLKNTLKEKGIIFGIQEDNLNTAVREALYNQPIIAATGKFPIHQIPSKPEYTFETDRGKPFKEREYNRIDLRELNFIQNKLKGDLLARLTEPVHPAQGRDVYGRSVAADIKADTAVLKAGMGAQIIEDGKEVRAVNNGNVKLSGNMIIVEPLIQVKNVDYTNGNMDFNGAVDIEGRIADGFTVKARGDIQVGKSVSKVFISSGGDMILKAGIAGNDEGVLFCGGDLYARYIENASVQCTGNIYVEEAIMHSQVKAGKDIILAGKRAEIFGGTVIAGGSVICKKLGNVNEPPTELHIGMIPEKYSSLLFLENEVKEIALRIDDNELKIRQIQNSAKNNSLNQETKIKLSLAETQLKKESDLLNKLYSSKVKQLHDIKRNILLKKNVELRVDQKIFGKVTVYFGTHKWTSSGKGTLKTTLGFSHGSIVEK